MDRGVEMKGKYTMATCSSVMTFLLVGSVAAIAQNTIYLGIAGKASKVAFVLSSQDGWGMEIDSPSAPPLSQPKPAQVEIDQGNGAFTEIAMGYTSVKVVGAVANAEADVKDGSVTFHISDTWTISKGILEVHRLLNVLGSGQGGFSSAVMFTTSQGNQWGGIKFFAPGVIYGDTSHDGARSPGGPINDALKRFSFREDFLEAPLLAMSFQNGDSISVLDPTPQGDTTTAETRSGTNTTLVSETFKFGALGAHEEFGQGVQFGFWMPGTINDFSGPRGDPGLDAGQTNQESVTQSWRRRYNPIRDGFSQMYNVRFRFGADEDFL